MEKMKMRKITLEMLREKEACEYQVNKFENLFPVGVEFKSEEDAVEKCLAVHDEFEWNWAAKNLTNLRTYFRRYVDDELIAWREYQKTRNDAWTEYQKMDYDEGFDWTATEIAHDEFLEVTSLAHNEYTKACATLFAKAFYNDGV